MVVFDAGMRQVGKVIEEVDARRPHALKSPVDDEVSKATRVPLRPA